MGPAKQLCCIALALAMTGCGTLDKLTWKKNDPAKHSEELAKTEPDWGNDSTASNSFWTQDPSTAKSMAEMGEFSTSKNLKDPIKTRLAYASWLEQSEKYPEAREAYLKVLEKNSKNTEALLGLARIDRVYGRDKEADALLAKTLKIHPRDPKVLLAIGQAYLAREEYDKAIEKMRAAHDKAPYEKMIEYNLAIAEAEAGDFDQALLHFGHTVGKAEGYFNIGHILNRKGQKAEAEEYLAKAMRLKPELRQAETELAALRSANPDAVQPASFNRR